MVCSSNAQCTASYDYMPEDSKIEGSPGDDSSLMEEITDPEISTKYAATQVYIPHILFQKVAMQPTKLQEHVETDELDNVVQNKSEFDDSHDQILSTQTILDTGQSIDKKVLVVERKKPTVEPIKFQECWGQFYEHAKFYKGKHEELNGSPILRQRFDQYKNCGN
ncbi:unnamed protein product [Malus baccata var. baccata]